jgi:hypothetical protein
MLENLNFFIFYFFYSCASLYCFIFLIGVIGVKISSVLDRILEFLGKSTYSLSYVYMKKDTDPDLDRQALDADYGPNSSRSGSTALFASVGNGYASIFLPLAEVSNITI